MELRTETMHVGIEDSNTLSVALLGVAAQQLLADAYTQDRLHQRADDGVKPTLTQVVHGTAGLALTGEHHAVGLP